MSVDTWRTFTLGELGYFKNGINFSRDDFDSGYKIVNVKNLYDGRFASLTELDSVRKGIIKSDEYFLKTNDILFARSSVKASGAGQVAMVPDIPEKEYVYSGFIIRFRITENSLVDHHYLNYLLRSPQFREYFVRIAVGTTITNLSQRTLIDVAVPLPSIETQKRIAGILSALDEKIELNRQTNATLETIAQAIFKEWFVNYNYPGATGDFVDSKLGPIPAGWRVVSISELFDFVLGGDWGKEEESDKYPNLCTVIRGTDIDDILNAQIAKVPRRYIQTSKLKKRKLKEGDVVFEISGGSKNQATGRNLLITTPLLKLFDNQAIPASFCRLIRAKDLPTSIFLSTYLRIFYDAGGTWDFQLQSTGISNFQFSDFQDRHTLTLPPQELIEEFMAIAMPNYQSIGENIVQSITLAKTRDTLLPKLMRGEIIV